jgi:hypothetical protein
VRALVSKSCATWSVPSPRCTKRLRRRGKAVEDAERAQRRRDVDLGAPPARPVDDRVCDLLVVELLHPRAACMPEPRRVFARFGRTVVTPTPLPSKLTAHGLAQVDDGVLGRDVAGLAGQRR